MSLSPEVAEKIQSIESVTGKRVLWGVNSLLAGLLMGGISAELIANWSTGYHMVSLHGALIYLVPFISLLTLLGSLLPRFRPSRRQLFSIVLASLIIAGATGSFWLLLISFVAGMLMG